MESKEDKVKKERVVEARARNISHNVRCTECGSQSIEDSQADVAILLRKLIRDEIRSGKSDKEIFKKLEDEFGETVLYAPKFDMQTAALWLSPLLVAGAAGGIWAYKRYRQKTNVHIMALNLVRGVPLTSKEKETMLEVLTPPPSGGTSSFWWRSSTASVTHNMIHSPEKAAAVSCGKELLDRARDNMGRFESASSAGQERGVYPQSSRTTLSPEIETPNPRQQMGSYPQSFQTVQLPPIGKPWDSELFDCHKDPTNALVTGLFPCVTFGQIAEVMDACPFGTVVYMLTIAVCMEWFIGSSYRTRMRNRYGLVEAPFHDMISHFFCPFCSLCQEFRELKAHGLNPALGYQGILAEQLARQNGQQIHTPPPAQAMSM
ncbi:Cytochrome c-type biogenesis CcmH-like mitochondrial protein [Sesamum alatum]|uniref:Cytochrome c-type biogenesis protein n=1 Tax=Sesamum alatum TaxID=300844 RepID=A0AAE1YDN1_9LAMI|nr:Cytochrome c-type biogenesis CcmH-like mitochondrial protein [Sesamum alatum]